MHYQRFVILISFIVAAVLTPTPDVVNQLIFAAPMIILYQISVGLLWMINRNNKSSKAKSARTHKDSGWAKRISLAEPVHPIGAIFMPELVEAEADAEEPKRALRPIDVIMSNASSLTRV